MLKLKNNIFVKILSNKLFQILLLFVLLIIFFKFYNIQTIKNDLIFINKIYNYLIIILISWILILIIKQINFIQLIKQSFKNLINCTSNNKRLNILDVFRVIAICWIIVNHLGSEGRIDILERLPSGIIFKNVIHNNIIFGALIGNSALGVEIFLVLSGLLAAKTWNRNNNILNKSFSKKYFIFIIRRYFRIYPSVVAFLVLVSSPLINILLPKYIKIYYNFFLFNF